MTREEAITRYNAIKARGDFCEYLNKEMVEMAIQALSQEPQCTEHPCLGTLCRYYKEPCDDAISRDFQIGDEVRIIGSDPIYDDCDVGWVIRNASEQVKTMYVMRNDGSADEEAKAEWYRTGRHNDTLAEVIRALPSVTQKSVIEDIKADLINEAKEHMAKGDYNDGVRFGLMLAEQIVCRHRRWKVRDK